MLRPATEKDIPQINELARAMHAESQYRKFNFNAERFTAFCIWLLESPDRLLQVYERNGVIIGAISGVVIDHYFSDAKAAFEFGLYVLPEHRGRLAGYQLAKYYVAWAKSRGAGHVDMTITTGITESQTGKMYQQLGFAHFGSVYSLEV